MAENYFLPSLFKGLKTKECERIAWSDVYGLIKSDLMKENTEKYRTMMATGMETSAKILKKTMLAITPAIECKDGRKEENIVGMTGVSLCDFDHIDDPALLEEVLRKAKDDAHSMMVYRTISGKGVRIFFRVEMTRISYQQSFSTGNRYFSRLLGVESDGSCKNIGRTSLLCHDSDAYYNPDSEMLCLDVTPDGLDMGRCGQAVLRHLEAKGMEYVEGRRNAYISRACYLLNALGVKQENALKWAEEQFADYDVNELRGVLRACYQKTAEHGTMRLQKMEWADRDVDTRKNNDATVADIERFISHTAHLRHNIVSSRTEVRFIDQDGEPVSEWDNFTDRHLCTLWERMSKESRRINIQDISHVITSAYVPLYDPFRDYFDNLPEWDKKTDYIERVADMVTLKEDNNDTDMEKLRKQFRDCFKKWLIGIVASLVGESVNHEVLIFIGIQGIFKTTFFQYLFPPRLRDYYYLKTNTGTMTKDDHLAVAEYGLICLEEIESMTSRELNHIKALITDPVINERAAYAHYKENRRHIASFCGTGNSVQFLNDPTGNRRWLPFEVKRIADPHSFDYMHDSMFAQALYLYKNGFRYWFDEKETEQLTDHVSHFKVPSMEEELLLTYYRVPGPGEQYKLLSATNIMERINANIKGSLSVVRIGHALSSAGFMKVHQKSGNKYRVIELRYDEIEHNNNFTAPELPF